MQIIPIQPSQIIYKLFHMKFMESLWEETKKRRNILNLHTEISNLVDADTTLTDKEDKKRYEMVTITKFNDIHVYGRINIHMIIKTWVRSVM